jgi:CheY-like chemotaxis protein
MDIKMPRMDGIEATRRIRSSFGAYSRTPILALTANADPADAEIYRRTGANGVVSKPIRAEELLQAMAAVLGEAEAEEPLALAV